MEDDFCRNVVEGELSCSSILGVSCKSSGFIVLPNSAVLLDGQEMFKVNVGRKSLMTVGMISAFFSLMGYLSLGSRTRIPIEHTHSALLEDFCFRHSP
jgi:hypothetical protein